jgi:hypothetical protein
MNLRGNLWNVILKLLKKLERSQHLETEYACVAASYIWLFCPQGPHEQTHVG